MGKALIIVESAAKTRTIGEFLGPDYQIVASLGHVRDLPERELGVDVENGFRPTYRVLRDKSAVVQRLRAAVKEADRVYLATDPDREGEAIAWHLQEALKLNDALRIEFNEITRAAVENALRNPRTVDMRRVNAQQARRVLDRLVGYKLSGLLWRKIKNARSAGRVQSVAVRLIVEREREIRSFVPTEYWRIAALVHPEGRPAEVFEATLEQVNGEKFEVGSLPDEETARRVASEIEAASLAVADRRVRSGRRQPPPPHITSTLQREASTRLGFRARRTMAAAQELYEGVELADGTHVGLITYMRTDSTRVAAEAQEQAQSYIDATWGRDYVGRGRRGRAPKGAQDAHECIRPTSVDRHPDEVDRLLAGRQNSDARRLYRLIWNRFVASQMAPAELETTTVDISAGPHLLRASGTEVLFPGYMALTGVPQPKRAEAETAEGENGEGGEDFGRKLPELAVGDRLELDELKPSQHYTQPPPRFTEASLVKALEDNGIGRPSTYAPVLSTITERRYVKLTGRTFEPTPLGELVTDALVEHFPRIMDVDFTALLERELDDVEAGKMDWVRLLSEFYPPFEEQLTLALEAMERKRIPAVATDHACPKCGAPMMQREGRYGAFLGCSRYPDCDGIMRLDREGNPQPVPERIETPVKCERCGKPMILRSSRRGPFLGCKGYPRCRHTVTMTPELRAQLESQGITVPAAPSRRSERHGDESD